MNIIQRFDFLEVSRAEDLIFPEKVLVLGHRETIASHISRSSHRKAPTGISDESSMDYTFATFSQRDKFRIKIEQVAYSLAPLEKTLLKGIVEQGNDAQVVLAHERLKRSFPSNLKIMPTTQACDDAKYAIGSSARRASLVRRQRDNAVHYSMLQSMSKQMWQDPSRIVLNLKAMDSDHTIGERRLNVAAHNRRTSTPDEMKEIALLAIQAASEDGWDTEDEATLSSETSSTRGTQPCVRKLSPEGIVPLLDAQIAPKCRTYNPWESVDEDFTGIHFDFRIIGTSADDESALPHVLSPPLMHRLQDALPYCKRGESFWLKYSLVRDGASLSTFLNKLRGSKYNLMAIETVEGEVFGAFTGEPWHLDLKYYGSSESFVWRMRHHRGEISKSIAEQAQRESDIDVFRYSFENQMVQLCQSRPYRLAIGGGCCHYPRGLRSGEVIQPYQWGFAISFDEECLLEGISSPSISFQSPSLSELHNDGSKFEVLNLEVWALTPCLSAEEAEIMECRKAFLERESLNF